jgi:hypothetical protein
MAKRIIECQVSDEYVLGAGVVVGAAGSHDDVVLRLTFGEMWIGLNIYATFRDARGENPTFVPILPSMLVDGEVMVYDVPVPAAAKRHQGQMMLTLTGYSIVDGVQEDSATNTATAFFRVLQSDFALFDDGSVDVTIAQQMLSAINEHAKDVAESIGAINDTVKDFGDTMDTKFTEQDAKIDAFGKTVTELGANVTKFDNRVTGLEGRADNGEFKGDPGRGIKKGRPATYYAVGGEKPSEPTEYSRYYTTADDVPDGSYFWIKTVYTFTDGDEEAVITPIRFGRTGKQGPKGDPFGVSKVYSSVEEMNAGFTTDGLPEGSFVMINTGNVEDADNAKVYVKAADGYNFVVDLSGSPGIQGPKPEKGVDYFTPADRAEMVQDVLNALPNGDEVSY